MSPRLRPLLRRARLRLPSLRIGTFIGILHLIIGVAGAGIISAFSLYFIYQNGVQSILREVEDLAIVTENALEAPIRDYERGLGSIVEIEATLQQYLENRPELSFTILSPQGEPYLPGTSGCTLQGVPYSSPEVREALEKSIGHSIRTCPRGERTIFVAAAINHADEVAGILVLSAPFHQLMAPTYRTMSWLGIIALLIVAFTVFEGWLGSVYITRPLARLSNVAEKISQGDLTARAEPQGPLEVIHLAETLNAMAGRVQSSLDSMRAFVGNASHELRTPLTSLKLQVGALGSGACEEPEVARRFLGQIEAEIDRMVYMVNDMLDLSQIEGGGSSPERQPVNLAELSTEALAFWDARARSAGLTLSMTCDPDLPAIQGDAYRLRQLLDNLLDNAIKYTQPGGTVEVRLRHLHGGPRSTTRDGVRLEVRDTGIGIDKEHQPHIFDRFYRIEMGRRKPQLQLEKPMGSGLGLAIARSIAALHGGEIGVESEPGTGSIFWVELPA